MKKSFKPTSVGAGGVNTEAVTPKRLINAISIAIKYADSDDMQVKKWLESSNQHEVIDEICLLIEKSVDEKTWKKLKI